MKKKVIIIVIALITLAIVGIGIFGKSILFSDKLGIVNYWTVRAYTGDRITVNIHASVNGEPAKIANDNLDLRLSEKSNYTILRDRANSYDTYEYRLLIKSGNKEYPLNITVRHWNWWEIVESDLYIKVDTASETYTVLEDYTYTAENPIYNYHLKTENEPAETFNGLDTINISAGCKG